MTMIEFPARFEKETIQALDFISRTDQSSVAAVIRIAVIQYVKKRKTNGKVI